MCKENGGEIEAKANFDKALAKVQSVTEFLSTALEQAQNLDLLQALEKGCGWVVDSAADAFGAVKFLVGLFQRFTGQGDPDKLAYLAFTLAYKTTVLKVVKELPPPTKQRQPAKELATKFKQLCTEPGPALFRDGRYNLTALDAHPFVEMSHKLLFFLAPGLGYTDTLFTRFQTRIQETLPQCLKQLLAHNSTREKFAPLRERIDMGTGEKAAADALWYHAAYQQWQFASKPVFGQEPFSLAEVYVHTDCSVYTWEELHASSRGGEHGFGKKEHTVPDPFDFTRVKRQPLEATVLKFIKDKNHKEALVIQGAAGAGKSAFTLLLCASLVQLGLYPIRIRLRHIDLSPRLGIMESLAAAIRYHEEEEPFPTFPAKMLEEQFRSGGMFNRKVVIEGTELCPYILILDGWDEISTGGEGYRILMGRLLQQIRSAFLDKQGTHVRVILTGRPSAELTEASGQGELFLRRETPVLTLLPFTPEQLQTYLEKVRTAVEKALPGKGAGWKVLDDKKLTAIREQYKTDYTQATKKQGPVSTSPLEVLGLPLLAHLALRLFACTEIDPEVVLNEPVQLYRRLVDLTCYNAAKPHTTGDAADQPAGQHRIHGPELRSLLHQTAAAVSVMGSETISYLELEMRISKDVCPGQTLLSVKGADFMSRLLVSYYFKGGNTGLGCEFMHKSFREYLLAEGIVELLKSWHPAPGTALPERSLYWQDFAATDPRYAFIRKLAPLLVSQFLTPELKLYLLGLLRREIGRSWANPEQNQEEGMLTSPCTKEQWASIRDLLADLWDWWGEGVHLRPQPTPDRYGHFQYDAPAYVHALILHRLPLAPEPGSLPAPSRSARLDSLLGEPLFLLCAVVHGIIGQAELEAAGMERQNFRKDSTQTQSRRCQVQVSKGELNLFLFQPGGGKADHFRRYCHRITAPGYRSTGDFPAHHFCALITLVGSNLHGVDFSDANLSGADLRDANLIDTDLRDVNLIGANLYGADLRSADLRSADLRGADLRLAVLRGADLRGADLRGADLRDADLRDADLRLAVLHRALFKNTRILKSQLAQLQQSEQITEEQAAQFAVCGE